MNDPEPQPDDTTPPDEEGSFTARYPKDTPARIAARALIENGASYATAAKTVDVSTATIGAWVKHWQQHGWERPPKVTAVLPDQVERQQQTAPARQELEQQWIERRRQIGMIAGGLAGQALGRIRDLMPQAGQPEVVVEQARTPDGLPIGLPRHRVLVRVPSLEVWRLSEAAKTLFALADRATGVDMTPEVAVNLFAPRMVSFEERRRTVLDVLERLPEVPELAEDDRGSNGRESNGRESNGHHEQ